jgi:hypothetical protein
LLRLSQCIAALFEFNMQILRASHQLESIHRHRVVHLNRNYKAALLAAPPTGSALVDAHVSLVTGVGNYGRYMRLRVAERTALTRGLGTKRRATVGRRVLKGQAVGTVCTVDLGERRRRKAVDSAGETARSSGVEALGERGRMAGPVDVKHVSGAHITYSNIMIIISQPYRQMLSRTIRIM